MVEAFWLRHEFSLLTRKSSSHNSVIPTDGLPLTRVLIGANTNKEYTELSNKEDRIYKYNLVENRDSALHLTVEFAEKNTSFRFGRTYFLSNLS